jgi:hypothetical protein
MKKPGPFLVSLPVFTRASADNQKATERVENAGNVMKEILHVPDNIPQSLSGKADRVVVFVMKSAVPTPACANQLLETLNAGSPKNKSGT